jgi:hypothetical protein
MSDATLIAADEEHQMTWCCIQNFAADDEARQVTRCCIHRLCIHSSERNHASRRWTSDMDRLTSGSGPARFRSISAKDIMRSWQADRE